MTQLEGERVARAGRTGAHHGGHTPHGGHPPDEGNAPLGEGAPIEEGAPDGESAKRPATGPAQPPPARPARSEPRPDAVRPEDVWLADLRIRPYGFDDGERLRRMAGRLSAHSMHARFFTGTPLIPEAYVRSLAKLDHWDHDALAALQDGEIVGVAEYVRDRRAPAHAELAVLIADRWQRRGLARLLVAHLAAVAGRRGIAAFDASVMLGNAPAIKAIRSSWPQARPHREDGAARFELPLADLRTPTAGPADPREPAGPRPGLGEPAGLRRALPWPA